MWKRMAPTGALKEIHWPQDSDRRSLLFWPKNVHVASGAGCDSDAAGWGLSDRVSNDSCHLGTCYMRKKTLSCSWQSCYMSQRDKWVLGNKKGWEGTKTIFLFHYSVLFIIHIHSLFSVSPICYFQSMTLFVVKLAGRLLSCQLCIFFSWLLEILSFLQLL